ncbi:hypothetical protein SLS56_009120 [Neofusicoccum ribis]|uniref:Uncharacterized protein n=1 Tax=Neofusicoccum ribis TaxID=45134 RepID=A0ABR3SJ23_9PEZI
MTFKWFAQVELIQLEGNMDELNNMMRSYYSQLREVCAMAEDLKLWSFCTKDPAPTYHKDKLGAAMGMEDAAALGVMLDETTGPENMASGLRVWKEMRYPRATAVCIFGRKDPTKIDSMLPLAKKFVSDVEKPKDLTKWLWDYDVVADAKARLAEIHGHGRL